MIHGTPGYRIIPLSICFSSLSSPAKVQNGPVFMMLHIVKIYVLYYTEKSKNANKNINIYSVKV